MKGIFTSLRSYGQALALIPKLRLWKYFLIPGLISIAFAALFALLAWGFSDNLGDWIGSWLSLSEKEGWWANTINIVVRSFHGISGYLAAILITLFGFLLYKNIIIALIGPFMSPLSEKVERHLVGSATQSPPFWNTLFRGLRLGIRNLFREMLWLTPLFLIGLFPILSIFSTIAIFLIQAYYAGFGNFDFVMERHYSSKESIRYIRRNRGLALGNGIPFMLMLGAIVGIFFAPTLSTIAATIAFHSD